MIKIRFTGINTNTYLSIKNIWFSFGLVANPHGTNNYAPIAMGA